MAKIKIISDPYNQMITYAKWNESINEWKEISYDDNSNSLLVNEELIHGFFPFHVKTIVDGIISEYKDNQDKTIIVFEGTDDEYAELTSICYEDEYSCKVDLLRSDRRLANARDILPSITNIFAEHLNPLITKSIDEAKVEAELRKFSDASKDTVPICILGNYSAGKSTFINALIGNEILPSGDEPITAKVYQISRAPSLDRAFIELEYESEKFRIIFKEKETEIIYTGGDKPLYNSLKEKLNSMEGKEIFYRVHEALEIINGFDKNDNNDTLSNLITIQIPFTGGLWSQANRDFVIFDTPGSNSASNDKHLQVLKEQMHNLSNGLPIFVSEYDSLDSTDNERLYRVIQEVKELDSRFTMIVVNKADAARIPKEGFSDEERDNILGMAVPKHLYTEGIYFVSSIVGLGSKNDANFIDDHCAEIFDGEEKKYKDPTYRFYKTLYKNNIMPEQLKKRATEKASVRDDLVYTNSGLFSIEDEILTFAEKYSHYNKCKQAYLFLDRIIDHTTEEITKSKVERLEQRQRITENFEQDKKDLLEKIEKNSEEMVNEDIINYSTYMSEFIENEKLVYSTEEIEKLEKEFIEKQKEEYNYDEVQVEMVNARTNLGNNLKQNISKVLKERSIDALKGLSSDLKEDFGIIGRQSDAFNDTKHEVNLKAADELMNKIKKDFTDHISTAQTRIEDESHKFWLDKSMDIRSRLVELVAGSSVLSDDKKTELRDLILSYDDLSFEEIAEDTFIREDFEKGIWIGKVKIVGFDKLNIKKLVEKYNAKTDETINDLYGKISKTHECSLDAWLNNILDVIRFNVVEFNPELQEQVKSIQEISGKISDLEKRQIDLDNYTMQVKSMLDWSTV